MNAVGIPTNLEDDDLQQVLSQRSENVYVLASAFDQIQFVQMPNEPAARVYLPAAGLMFPSTVLNAPRHHFISIVDRLMQDAVMHQSMLLHQRAPTIKTVPQTFGRQFYMTRKLLDKMEETPPRCSICLEDLVPEGKQRKKVWQLHGPQCTFHIGCLRRWHKESSKCPNCNLDCA